MGIELAYQFFNDMINGWSPIGGARWLIPSVILAISLIWITRDPQKWKETGLIIAIGWWVAGLQITWWMVGVLGIIYVFEYISIEQAGVLVESATNLISGAIGRGMNEGIKRNKMIERRSSYANEREMRRQENERDIEYAMKKAEERNRKRREEQLKNGR